MPYLTAYRETISILIDKGETTSPQNGKNNPLEEAVPDSLYAQRHNETMYFNRAMQSFWLGYATRCHHYAKKALEMKLLGRHNKLMILFYAALNSFRGIKNTNGNGSQFAKVKPLFKDAITALRSAAELSPCNFSNKVSQTSVKRSYTDSSKLATQLTPNINRINKRFSYSKPSCIPLRKTMTMLSHHMLQQ